MEFAQGFVQHPSGYLWVPVIKCAEKREQNPTNDHVVKMRDNEIRAAKLPIERRRTKHDAGEAGNQKLEQEADTEKHRRPELELTSPHRTQPVEDLDAGRYTHSHRRDREKAVGVGVHPDREHVVSPYAH